MAKYITVTNKNNKHKYPLGTCIVLNAIAKELIDAGDAYLTSAPPPPPKREDAPVDVRIIHVTEAEA